MTESPNVGLRKFLAPEFVLGKGAWLLAPRYAENYGVRRPMLVTDSGLIASGWAGKMERALADVGMECVLFQDVTPNPKDHEVMEGARVYAERECDALVALGGGSVLDCAKGIGVVHANGGHILDYEGVDTIPRALPPLLCIPTTSGSSADVSQFAIISDTTRKVKIALVSKMLVPDVSLIDPTPATTMSPALTAETGIDALTHAVEAYVSNASSPVTDLFALESVRLARSSLGLAVREPHNMEARGQMCLASLDAGLAFSNAILGAVHSMAHSLGGSLDLPHGECNAILLGPVIAFNFPSAPQRYREVARAMGCVVDGQPDSRVLAALLDSIRLLRSQTGLTRNLADLGVTRADIPRLASMAMKDPCLLTNPRVPVQADIEAIYEAAL
ncbi:1,3-propanediol dehydrogenase [Fundidesulfovibrio magnetotacticus]|uniref:1,3-propanediol dehydrogenase n=1 Tax=Fundidesulfovibrio magnetotacticus TaxID=2730080 RepID=A0A6V8LWT9_9BACT|nr:alcohol dehydrogenase-like regulatory protein ErcA [Fundidesulfovibrio magnetotacticus]GFK94549.1 1,3-propanediol dehydrogenase [Fundidesulfovibrio magnetotacticus]